MTRPRTSTTGRTSLSRRRSRRDAAVRFGEAASTRARDGLGRRVAAHVEEADPGAGGDGGVEAVEDVVIESHSGAGEKVVELFGRPWSQKCSGDGRVGDVKAIP